MIFIRFRGTNYYGFQVQKDKPTITKAVQDAIERLTGSRSDIKGCSRTDAGVHANMYCISFKTSSVISDKKMAHALNNILPADIVCYKCILVPENFHARYFSTGKEYIYVIKEGRYSNPILEGLVYNYPYKLNLDKMITASKEFEGTHDFYSFSGKSEEKNTIKTIDECSVIKKDDLIYIKVVGHSFLMHMVRIIVGTLVDIGNNKIEITDIKKIMDIKDRTKAGSTAPAHGLYLNKIFYNDNYGL